MWNASTINQFNDSFPTTSPVVTELYSSVVETEAVDPALEHCPDMQTFGKAYKEIHGYASLTVCIFGTIANVLNVIVLTRKEMITPTNYILTALAIADLLNMVEYVPFAIYMKFLPDLESGGLRMTYGWAVFVLFHCNFSQICHTTAIWLTLTLAIWRYIMVTRPVQCKSLCSMERAKLSIALAYIVSPLLCIPIFCSFSVTPTSVYSKGTRNASSIPSTSMPFLANENSQDNYTNITSSNLSTTELPGNPVGSKSMKYVVNLSTLAKSFPLLKQINFWFFSIVIKLIPCAILTVVSFRLVHSLLEAKKRKQRLLGENSHTGHPQVTSSNNLQTDDIEIPSSRSCSFTRSTGEVCATTRTTRMLLAILVLFLVTELPQGILALLSDLMGEEFFQYCYMSLSDLMDFVALLNSGINFILYCTMSNKFRIVFVRIFRLDVFLSIVSMKIFL